MTIDVATLVRWLGPAGARAGIEASGLTVKDLVAMARASGLPVSPKPSRKELAHELCYAGLRHIDKSTDELLAMNGEALLRYLKECKPTRAEIIKLLSDLGVKVGSEASKNLLKFAAREISDIGMYQRVAHAQRDHT